MVKNYVFNPLLRHETGGLSRIYTSTDLHQYNLLKDFTAAKHYYEPPVLPTT